MPSFTKTQERVIKNISRKNNIDQEMARFIYLLPLDHPYKNILVAFAKKQKEISAENKELKDAVEGLVKVVNVMQDFLEGTKVRIIDKGRVSTRVYQKRSLR